MVPRCPERLGELYGLAPERLAAMAAEETQPTPAETGAGCFLVEHWGRLRHEPPEYRRREACAKCAIATGDWERPSPLYLRASRVIADLEAGFAVAAEDDVPEVREAVRTITAAQAEWMGQKRRERRRTKDDGDGRPHRAAPTPE